MASFSFSLIEYEADSWTWELICFRMADDSKIVLHWEIDNATAKFATGRVESDVFDVGGFRWLVNS